jgi:hypothetical protein
MLVALWWYMRGKAFHDIAGNTKKETEMKKRRTGRYIISSSLKKPPGEDARMSKHCPRRDTILSSRADQGIGKQEIVHT